MDPNINEYLSSCVSSLHTSTSLLNESIALVDQSTTDIHRLNKILTTETVFGIVPQVDLKHSIKTIREDLQPKIELLTNRYQQEINQLRSRNQNLKHKIELQKMRLNTIKLSRGSGNKEFINDKILRINFLKNKKSRLRFALSKLQLEDQKRRLSTA